jgi:AcrR family transcriptional regulator
MEHPAMDTRTALLHAAIVCFSEHGFDGTSMRAIAARAERPLSLLFHHFKNKEGLYIAVFEYLFEGSLKITSEQAVPEGGFVPRDKDEAMRRLREQIHSLYGNIIRRAGEAAPIMHCGGQLLMKEIHDPRPSLLALVTAYTAPITGTIRNCIRILRPDLGASEVAFLGASIMGTIVGHGSMYGMNKVIWEEAQGIGSPFQASEWLVEFCTRGVLGGTRPD